MNGIIDNTVDFLVPNGSLADSQREVIIEGLFGRHLLANGICIAPRHSIHWFQTRRRTPFTSNDPMAMMAKPDAGSGTVVTTTLSMAT